MEANSPRWIEITRSEFPWEREALTFVRERLPDHEPYRAWSNFEFIADDGSINEVDLLVLSPMGFFLIEIKSRPGKIEGDAGTWAWHNNGRVYTDDNPLQLANRKAKKLISLLRRQQSIGRAKPQFLEPLIFLSHETNTLHLPEYLREKVFLSDREKTDDKPGRKGILSALIPSSSSPPRTRNRPDRPIAKAISRAMDEAGIRPSKRARRIQDYELKELLFEGPTYQDWLGEHVSLKNDIARVRVYSVEQGASEELRNTISSAAKREKTILEGISHDGILAATNYTESDRGPALFFQHFKEAKRFDHYLAENLDRLGVDQRLNLLRQIAETIQFATERKLIHRALSPQSILVVDPGAENPRLKILNWQTGARERTGTRMTSAGLTATSNVDQLIEDTSAVYMAPEALSERGGSGPELDVFSLGALAFHLLSGKPPAQDLYELMQKLRENKGLKLSSVLDGAPQALEFLIEVSTHPEATTRLDSPSDFLEYLDEVEEELTAPDAREGLVDPIEAKPSDQLEHGWVVKRRLGKGSTAIALLVEREGIERVLKVALEPSLNDQLRAEGERLRRLRHQFIVEFFEELDFGDRAGLLMARAGNETLAQRIREEGRLALEMLETFGEDLLQTVDWLDQKGAPHRDIKPENLGVAKVGKGDALHLVLFDFSLAGVPAENVRAGTVPYLDPFLMMRKPPRWDVHAERFAAAMTLYEMATGSLPVWGDGRSDPAVIDDEVTVDAEAFEPALRDKLAAFFEKALRRDAAERFDNAHEMLSAWRDALAGAAEPAVSTQPSSSSSDKNESGPLATEDVELTTPLILLGFSTRAINALDRVGAGSVEDLLQIPPAELSHMRGVGTKTRKEIAAWLRSLTSKFPDVRRKNAAQRGAPTAPAPAPIDTNTSVDAIAEQLLAKKVPTGSENGQRAMRLFLRLEETQTPGDPSRRRGSVWPSQSESADQVGVTRARIGQVLDSHRKKWSKLPDITALREEIVVLLDSAGGVMTATELADAILASRGSDEVEPNRSRLARAVTRAAIETERTRASARWIVRRPHDGGRLLVARDELNADGETQIDGQGLADYAEALGKVADRLAEADPLLAADRATEALAEVMPPRGISLPSEQRMRQLAVSTARTAALSSRMEVYPFGMDSQRALKLALGALSGAKELFPEQIRERVEGRYPEAAPLPDRPELDELLAEAGSELRWQQEGESQAGVYKAPLRTFTTVLSGTSVTRATPVEPRFEEVGALEAERTAFQTRLENSLSQRGFLALAISTRRVLAAEQQLASRFELDVRSADEILIRLMKQFAVERNIDWQVVQQADAVPPNERASNRAWSNLLRVVEAAVPRMQTEICESNRPVLLTQMGLLARYGQLDVVTSLKEATDDGSGPPGLWLLVPSGDSGPPMLDGYPIPVFSTAQWASIPRSWLDEADRA